MDIGPVILAVAVNNSRTRVGLIQGDQLDAPQSFDNADTRAIVDEIAARVPGKDGRRDATIVMSSVNDPVADRIAAALESRLGSTVYRVGRDLPVPMRHALDDASTVGQDRLLCALAAFARSRQACVVIDVGTAVTVDFVDGEGAFQGGCIAPGLNLMLRALHEHTAALPEMTFTPPDPARGQLGKDTRHAMLLGVRAAVKGLVRERTEAYAEFYGAYPRVVATGGDAAMLFEGDDLVEQVVPDLQLAGIAELCKLTLQETDESEDDL